MQERRFVGSGFLCSRLPQFSGMENPAEKRPGALSEGEQEF